MHDAAFFQKHDIGGYLGDLFDNMPGFLYFVKDTRLRMVALNRRLADTIDVEDKQLILGMTDHDCLPHHLADIYREDDLKVINTGQAMINKVELVTQGNGLVDWSTTTKSPIMDGQGVVRGLVGITRPFQGGITALQADGEMGPVVAVMKRRYQENISVDDLASLVNMSISSFERKFKKYFSMPPKQYMRYLRVQEACHKLVQTTDSLAQIGMDCGYADQSHFSREFMRIIKETPRHYRMRFRV